MIRLEPLTLTNWEAVAHLSVTEAQGELLPDNLFSIAQAKFEPDSEVLGIYKDQRPVGMLLIAQWAGVFWITRVMIDQFEQGNGYGTRAVELACKYIFGKRNVKEIRTTVAQKNALAEHVFCKNGFERMATQPDDKELVLHRMYDSRRRL